jgi:hypothetical protein
MGKHEAIVAAEPPGPRAPSVLEQRPALERELADLKQRIAETTLAAYEGKPDGRKNLAALHDQIRIVTFQLEGSAAALELAQHLDQAALSAWKAAVQMLPPEEIVDGITKEACCRRCIGGCAITAADPYSGPCGHPVLVGALELNRYRDNPKILAIYDAACRKLGLMRKLHA